jgi:hypothetical protein
MQPALQSSSVLTRDVTKGNLASSWGCPGVTELRPQNEIEVNGLKGEKGFSRKWEVTAKAQA